MTPLFSVVVPNYGWKPRGFLSEPTCLKSHDLGSDVELVVIDDGSSAKDREQVGAFLAACRDAAFISLTRNEGPGSGRRVSLERASNATDSIQGQPLLVRPPETDEAVANASSALPTLDYVA